MIFDFKDPTFLGYIAQCEEEEYRNPHCDFCAYAIHEEFNELDRDNKLCRIIGEPIDCKLHKIILPYCKDFHYGGFKYGLERL